jgi:hypothetical protein
LVSVPSVSVSFPPRVAIFLGACPANRRMIAPHGAVIVKMKFGNVFNKFACPAAFAPGANVIEGITGT